jgi:hypothetical protein
VTGGGHILHPGSPAASGSDQQLEQAERAFPFNGVNGPHLGVDELERPGQGDADAPEEQREPGLGVLAQRVIERRPGGQGFEDGPQFDLLLEALERVRALLQPLGDRQVPGSMMSRAFALAVAWPMSSRS